jgi:ATP-dependent exoDNAse (exonuclease V) beta subunit
VRVVLEAPFDVAAPLAHRSVRFWPKVFADNRKGVPILDAIEASDEAHACERSNTAELRRLAYVGTTRARDRLIIALPEALKPTAWLRAFADETLLPTGAAFRLPDGDVIASGYADLAADGAPPAPQLYRPMWFQQRTRLTPAREALSPSRAEPVDSAQIVETVDLGTRIALRGDDMTSIGTALHRVIAAELVNPDRADATARAAAILRGFGAEAFVDADAAVDCARRFRAFVVERLKPLRLLCELPVVHALDNGQVLRGWIDALLETADGWVVIDHKSSPRPKREWAVEALSHSGQLACYRSMIAASGARLAPFSWVHFPVGGGMIRIAT